MPYKDKTPIYVSVLYYIHRYKYTPPYIQAAINHASLESMLYMPCTVCCTCTVQYAVHALYSMLYIHCTL